MLIYNLLSGWPAPSATGSHSSNGPPDMGFDWVFINPVQKPGYSGSLYSIVDYFQLNPLLVDPKSKLSPEQQIKAALATAEQLGLKVMVDLVINHCAFDSELTRQHPEWFVQENGNVAHPFCMENGHKVVWGDLALFNHTLGRGPRSSPADRAVGVGPLRSPDPRPPASCRWRWIPQQICR